MTRNSITIELLETLDAIDRRGSFAKAAEELNKATSAVSYAVQRLEEQMGIALFQRQGRRSVLTPAGQLILSEGREILSATGRLTNKAKELATGWEPRIRIAIESIQTYSIIFDCINDFLREHPTIEIDIRESVLSGSWEALEQDNIDLLIGAPSPVPQQKGFRTEAISKTDLFLVISANHPKIKNMKNMTQFETVSNDIRQVIVHDTAINNVRRSEDLSVGSPRFHVQTIEQKLEAILAGIGYGRLPYERIKDHLKSGQLISIKSAQNRNNQYLAWKTSNKGKGLKNLVKRLSASLNKT